MRQFLAAIATVLVVPSGTTYTQGQKTLDIYSIDVEGGQSTLFVSPSGESLLVDTGSPGERDADRIVATAKEAGLARIDYLVITHYDGDHVGGAKEVSDRLPIRTFIDHGPRVPPAGAPPLTPQAQANLDRLDAAYAEARAKGRHVEAKAGDKVPIRGLDVQIVSSRGEVITKPLAGPGAPNPLCRDFVSHGRDTSENINSVGIVISGFGPFRMLDLGDLTWNTEHDLVCPNNLLGIMDVYLTTHHGLARSGPPALVHAIGARIAVMNNGPRKGDSRETWETLKSAPGLEDIWQLHYSVQRPPNPAFEEKGQPGGNDANAPEQFIANLDEATPSHSPAYSLKISVRPDGSFVVMNARNGYSKEYTARSSLFAQQGAPEISFDSIPNFLKLPPGMNFGEVPGVAVNSKGHIFVFTRSNSASGPAFGATAAQLLEFGPKGELLREIGKGLYGWSFAHSVRIDKDDNIWAIDKGSDMIIKFNPAGRVVWVFGRKAEAADGAKPWEHVNPPLPAVDGLFRQPTDVAWDSDGNTYIADGYVNSRVAKYDKHGDWVKSWGTKGTGPGQFNLPHSIAVDRNNNIYVGDRSNHRVQVFDTDGTFLRMFSVDVPPVPGTKPVNGNTPTGDRLTAMIGAPNSLCITQGPNQVLFLGESTFPGRIFKLTLDGKVLGVIGRSGRNLKQFSGAHALACPSETEVYVAESSNWRVQKLILH